MAKHVIQNMTAEELEVILNRTQNEVNMIKEKDCISCTYSSNHNKKYASQITCDYITIVGHSRPCLAGDCRQAGIWKEKQKNKKARDFKINLEEDYNG
jgi:hypothetical protein